MVNSSQTRNWFNARVSLTASHPGLDSLASYFLHKFAHLVQQQICTRRPSSFKTGGSELGGGGGGCQGLPDRISKRTYIFPKEGLFRINKSMVQMKMMMTRIEVR